MFETNNTRLSEAMVVSGMQATQLARVSSADANRRQSGTQQQTQGGAAQSLSMSQAETILQQLVEDGWLEKSRKGFYSLSPRGLMELRGWLVATYNDEHDEDRRADKIKFCAACRDIITVVSISISRVYAFHADFSRANAAPTVIAPVDCTICALATSFACSKQNNVPFVMPHGRMTSLWAKKPSPRRISICRASDAAPIPSSRMVLGLARRRALLLARRMKKVATRTWGDLYLVMLFYCRELGQSPQKPFAMYCRELGTCLRRPRGTALGLRVILYSDSAECVDAMAFRLLSHIAVFEKI